MTRANPNPPAADPDAEFLDAVEPGGNAAAPVGNAQGGNANGADESEDDEVEVDENLCKCTIKFLTEEGEICDLEALKLTLAKDVPAIVERVLLLTKTLPAEQSKKIRITPVHVIYLQGLRYWIDYCEQTHRQNGLDLFHVDVKDKWVGRVRKISTKMEILKADGAHIALPLWSAFNKDYRMWENAFLSFLGMQLTTLTRTLLLLILRTNVEPLPDARTVKYPSIDEDLAANTYLEGPNYRNDNNRVFAFHKESLKGMPLAFNMIQ
jgi:hypothetical protein